jgi:hypothetical protein
MTRFGPGRGELWFRLIVSLAGLATIGVAAAVRPVGPAWIEIVGLGGAFFGGTALWSARALRKARRR